MSSATAGTRLAAVANQRRQQRKQLKNAATENNNNYYNKSDQTGKEISTINSQHKIGLTQALTASTFDDSTVSSHGSFFSASTGTDRESKENICKRQPKLSLTCTTTETTACDESTISSVGDWSSQKKNQGQFSSPPMTILSPSKKILSNNIQSSTNARRLRNSKLRGGRYSSDDSVAPSNTPSSNAGKIASKSSVVSSTTMNNNTMHLCKTPKYNNLSHSKQAKMNSDSSMVSFVATTTNTQDQIRQLTLERENLQSDVALYKRKLQNAIESNTKNAAAQDALILGLEDKIESLSAEVKQKEGDALMATLQAREMEKLVAVDDERKRSLHRRELKAVESELKKAEEELARAKKLNEHLISEKESLESKGNELCKVLQQVEEERSNMKSRVTKYSEQLSKVQMECEVCILL
jgi:hypothetical protein